MSVASPPSFRRAEPPARPARKEELRHVVRAAREQLVVDRRLPQRFERELLQQHAATLRTAASILPLPIILTAFGLSLFVAPLLAAAWAAFALAGPELLLVFANRLKTVPRDEIDIPVWTRRLFLAHLLAAFAWAGFAAMECDACAGLQFDLFQFAVVVTVVALTALLASLLRNIVLVFAPLAVVLLLKAAAGHEELGAVILILPVAAVPLFAAVAYRLRSTAIGKMRHQAEKDELIAELEQSRILSDEARRRAEDANLAKSRFLATMSHELRTPLNAILGFSEVITNEILGPIGNPTYAEYVEDIQSSGRHLLDLINEILDLSRIEAGRYNIDEEAVDLVRIATACVGYVQLKADAKQLTIQTRFEEDLPLLWADPRAMRQIILNLLSNAVKFAPASTTVVVRVGWTAGGGQYVSVADDGPGIPEEEIPLVLSTFGQGSLAIKSAEQGAGLGLPIVQALVHLHHGEFQLHSKLREGTEAIAIFPHARVLEVMPAMAEFV